MIDHTHNKLATSWAAGDHALFPVQNLPLGVFCTGDGEKAIGAAIGDHILNLRALSQAGHLPEFLGPSLSETKLNALFALPPSARLTLRHALFALLTDPASQGPVEPHLVKAVDCTMHLPFAVGDYTDFYVGFHHANNVGALFRPDNPLLPNYRHVPIGYHGRASSVRVSGTAVRRPHGQTKAPDAQGPTFGPTKRLDYELELGVWIAGDNALGDPVPIAQAWDRIGGICVLNDWSARDVQAWEYQPLGPFLAKNFCTSVSPWVVTAEALTPFRMAPPPRPAGDPQPLPYLDDASDRATGALSLEMEVTLSSAAMREAGLPPHRLSRGNSREAMYWTLAQLVAHHTSNGCDLHSGDLLGTGTLSGAQPESLGSLLEQTAGGKRSITLPGGETRGFLADGDSLTITVWAQRDGFCSIGLGSCTGMIEPAR